MILRKQLHQKVLNINELPLLTIGALRFHLPILSVVRFPRHLQFYESLGQFLQNVVLNRSQYKTDAV